MGILMERSDSRHNLVNSSLFLSVSCQPTFVKQLVLICCLWLVAAGFAAAWGAALGHSRRLGTPGDLECQISPK